MDINCFHLPTPHSGSPHAPTKPEPSAKLSDESAKPADDAELKKAFTDFVGQTLFGSMLASMRKTVGKPAYMHGGRTEEVFQQQLDQPLLPPPVASSFLSLMHHPGVSLLQTKTAYHLN